jgi:glucose-6-phosphate isomerase
MLELDHTNLESSLAPIRERLTGRVEQAWKRFEGFRGASTYYETIEPGGQAYVDEIRALAEALRGEGRTHFVNLGIGGSSLGGEALLRALTHPYQNELPLGNTFSRYYFPDNVDPELNAGLLDILPVDKTLIHIASKSGSTAETAAQTLLYLQWMEDRLGAAETARRVVVSTDPEKGDLRQIVRRKDFRALSIPAGMGGRFSVFGSVGLLPLALFGLDIDAFLAGARSVAEQCSGPKHNPAFELALAMHAQQVDLKRNIVVCMAYSEALAPVGDWFGQLWGESLGKNLQAGSTPVRAVGATDQHSQLQLYMEGPDDKFTIFLRVGEFRRQVDLPRSDLDFSSTRYLMGQSMNELLRVEAVATEKALTDAGRPNVALTLDAINERSLGALLYFLQVVTVYAGALYAVNPFDQPGVEAGKRLTFGHFGREGYEKEGTVLKEYQTRRSSTVRIGGLQTR